MAIGQSSGHVQSLILACTLIIIGFLTFMIGLVADVIVANRKHLQDTQYHARKTEYDAIYVQMNMEREVVKTYQVVGKKYIRKCLFRKDCGRRCRRVREFEP